jgi:hypothetical protein
MILPSFGRALWQNRERGARKKKINGGELKQKKPG